MPDLSRVNINLADEPLNVAINARIERALPTELPRRYLGAIDSSRVLASDAV